MRTSISTVILGLLSANALAAQHTMPAQPAVTPEAPAAAQPAAIAGSVARAQFTSGVQEREPVDNLTTLGNDKTRMYFFTELKNFTGSRVTHRWEHGGKVIAEVPHDVGAERWRVWSYVNLDPALTGEWKVSVVDTRDRKSVV